VSIATVLKLAAWGIIIAVALQVIFYFVFQIIGCDAYLLSITLIVSVTVGIVLLIGWSILKRALR
jgi:hypothetical protein